MATRSNDRAAWLRALVVASALAALVFASLATLRPVAPVGVGAPSTDFSSARAMKHLAVIAARPHRMGSPAHDEVRAYLMRELAALGLAPQVQEASVAQLRFAVRWGWPARVATVKNVVARLRGTEGGRAVLLVAHYDTRSMTPGAGDDGAAVAAMLETARALVASPPPKHDVIFLLTDGEELGLLGAKAFVDEHPASREAGVVLNFDARGDRGPAIMFQTSDGAARLVAELARTVEHPIANSLAQAVYKQMPNDSDLSEILPTGVDAMNVGYIGGLERYHAPTDTVANMSEATLQHVGSYMLPLARRFADLPLPLPKEGDATYFGAGPFFVRYAARADVAIALGADALLVATIIFALRKKRARAGGVAVGFGVALGATIGAALVAYGAWTLGGATHRDYAIVAAASGALKDRWGAAFALFGVAVAVGLQAAAIRRLRAIESGLGAAIVLGLLAVPSAAALPGGGWCAAWPLLGAIAPWAIANARRAAGDPTDGLGVALRVAACALPIALLAPLVAVFYDAFGPGAAPIVGALAGLTTVLAAPAIVYVLAPDRRVASLVALAAFAMAGVAWTTPAFDRASPRPHTIFFASDLDARKSWWVSPDAPNEWTTVLAGATRGALPPYMFVEGGAALASREVPFVDAGGVEVRVVRDDRAEKKTLELLVVPPRGAEVIAVRASGAASVSVQGRALPGADREISFYYSAPPAAGFAMTLGAPGRIELRVSSQRAGFPRALEGQLGPRPEALMPKSGMLPPWDEMQESDMTVTTQKLEL